MGIDNRPFGRPSCRKENNKEDFRGNVWGWVVWSAEEI
jgi:hypothetical protein